MQRRIATFNLGNLARPGAVVYETEPRTAEEYGVKRDFLRGIVARIDADLLAVQEVFHRDALVDALAPTFAPEQIHDPLPAGVTEETARSPRVALATRLPMIGPAEPVSALSRPHEIFGVRLEVFRRPVLRAHIALGGEIGATVLAMHLKSPRPYLLDDEDPGDPAAIALAEARAESVRAVEVAEVKRLVAQASQQGPVILLGDLNAGLDAPALRALRGRRAPMEADEAVKAAFDAARLYDAGYLAQRSGGVAFGPTYLYGTRPEAIDHVLLSSHFTPFGRTPVARVTSVRSLSDHLGPDPALLVRLASDHAPLIATFEVPDDDDVRTTRSSDSSSTP